MSKFTISLSNEKSLLCINALINKKIKFIFNEDVYFGILKKVNVNMTRRCEIIRSVGYDSYQRISALNDGLDGLMTYLIEDLNDRTNNSFCISYHEKVSIIELQENPNDFGFVL
jgi:hypothetical protein